MRLVYVATSSIILLLNNALDIEGVQRVPRGTQLQSHVLRFNDLTATPDGRPSLRGDGFETDGLGCIRLLWWIINERPAASSAARLNRFNALFSNNPTDALKAGLRIFIGTDATAPGEDGYFCAQQWRSHPNEMASLRALGSIRRAAERR